MFARDLPACSDLWTPVPFWVWKEPLHLLRLSLAEGSPCSREIRLQKHTKKEFKNTILSRAAGGQKNISRSIVSA